MPHRSYITEPFQPAPLLAHPHAQTLGAYLLRRGRRPPLRRERWETPDGDFVDVDWLEAPKDRPHLLVLHGLEGSSGAGYVVETLRLAARRGFGALALNFRSCSGEPNRLWRSYNSGDTADARLALERLSSAGVTGPLLGIGFSLGGNVLLKLLAELGEDAPLTRAAAVSVPCDLFRCARLIDAQRGLGSVYREVFLWSLRRKALEKLRRLGKTGTLDAERIRQADGLVAFDDVVTAPVHGFEDAADYYAKSSSGPLLGAIRRPTLLVFSADDPLVPHDSFPGEAADNPALTVVTTSKGGHVGFLAGRPWRPRFWAEEQALAFLASGLPASPGGSHKAGPG